MQCFTIVKGLCNKRRLTDSDAEKSVCCVALKQQMLDIGAHLLFSTPESVEIMLVASTKTYRGLRLHPGVIQTQIFKKQH